MMYGRMRFALPYIILLSIIPHIVCPPLQPDVSLTCGNDEKQCRDMAGKCVEQKQICDGVADCPDESDEMNCDIPTFEEFMEMEYLYCKQDEFKCPNSHCIPLRMVCDGKSDCPRGDDEGGMCGACEDYGCASKCQDFPSGPKCKCPSHMFLSVDTKTCEHEEQCVIGGGHNCSQHCRQIHDLVTCSCNAGYSLSANGFDCELNTEHRVAYLFIVSNTSAINRVSLFGNSSESSLVFVPKSSETSHITSLAYHNTNQMLYFVVDERHRHTRIYISNGIESRSLFYGFGVRHIAVDWIANNIYYASDGLGIGVCTSDGRFCRHLILPNGPLKDNQETFGGLIVHPARGILIWLHYSPEHPNGVIMAAGMDGSKPRILTQLTMKRLSSLAIDYVMDHLYFVEEEQLYLLDLHTLLKHSVNHLSPPAEMLVFNDHLYYVSSSRFVFDRLSGSLMQFNKKTDVEVQFSSEKFVGSAFPLAINNSAYYQNISNPCDSLDCMHICVLSEVGIDKLPKAMCTCPNKYFLNEDGVCILSEDVEGPVRTSVAYMETLCANEIACFNGGTCPDDLTKAGDLTPFCDCPAGFNGLYCEVALPGGTVDEGSSVFMVLCSAFLLSASLFFFIVILLTIYPGIRQRIGNYSNMKVSPAVDRLRSVASASSTLRRGGARAASPDDSTTPMLSRSPSANFSPPSTSLLRNADVMPTRPIHISTSFSNPSFYPGESSLSAPTPKSTSHQRREDAEQIEREIQNIGCPKN